MSEYAHKSREVSKAPELLTQTLVELSCYEAILKNANFKLYHMIGVSCNNAQKKKTA